MARKWWTLVAVCTATFMLLLDITIVNVALPAIERALDASFSDLQWVVDAYALGLATCVLTAGALADLFGRKRLFLIGVVLFTIASAACGIANDARCLILALIEGNRRGWSSDVIVALLVVAALALAAFIASQAVERTSMVDLALFKRPAFVGAQITAFAISSSMFAMFLYLTLYLQNIL